MAAPAEVPDDAGLRTVEPGVDLGDPWAGLDAAGLKRAVSDQAARPVTGVGDMASYLAAAVSDVSHREVVGPLLNGGGASGVVLRRGTVVASWGDPARSEMAFSATKSVLALVAGVAFDDGLLRLDEPVCRSVRLPQFAGAHGRASPGVTCWTRPANGKASCGGSPRPPTPRAPGRERSRQAGHRAGWAYNDVRVNLTALALTGCSAARSPTCCGPGSWTRSAPQKGGPGTATPSPW